MEYMISGLCVIVALYIISITVEKVMQLHTKYTSWRAEKLAKTMVIVPETPKKWYNKINFHMFCK